MAMQHLPRAIRPVKLALACAESIEKILVEPSGYTVERIVSPCKVGLPSTAGKKPILKLTLGLALGLHTGGL